MVKDKKFVITTIIFGIINQVIIIRSLIYFWILKEAYMFVLFSFLNLIVYWVLYISIKSDNTLNETLKKLYKKTLTKKWNNIVNNTNIYEIFTSCPFCKDATYTSSKIYSCTQNTICFNVCRINHKICGFKFSLLNRLRYYCFINYNREKINKLIQMVKDSIRNEISRLDIKISKDKKRIKSETWELESYSMIGKIKPGMSIEVNRNE